MSLQTKKILQYVKRYINQWGGQNFWNVGYDFHEGYSVNDIDFLINLAQHLQVTYNLSAENTFMTGMSNGAELCYLIACEAPGFFKAFAPVADEELFQMV